jgi:SAM-dependent methyltransferase
MSTDDKRHSPAAERNSAPILVELQRLLPPSGVLLEVSCGTGQHAAAFSAGLPGWTWIPSDVDPGAFSSVRAWCVGRPNVSEPLQIDVRHPRWAGVPTSLDAIFCANMIHVAPWECCVGLFEGASRQLAQQGVLITYGPYLEDEVNTSPGNIAFDADLRGRNPAWGLRRREDVEEVAARVGLNLRERVAMPANNLLLAWGRRARA